MKTHYDVLGIPADADAEAIKAAYRGALKEHHPDLHKGDSRAEERSKAIIEAYNLLKDPERRTFYDERLRHRRLQRRRLVLIAVLISGGISATGSLGLLYAALTSEKAEPPEGSIAVVASAPAGAAQRPAELQKAPEFAPPPAPSPAEEEVPSAVVATAQPDAAAEAPNSDSPPQAAQEIVTAALPEGVRNDLPSETPDAATSTTEAVETPISPTDRQDAAADTPPPDPTTETSPVVATPALPSEAAEQDTTNSPTPPNPGETAAEAAEQRSAEQGNGEQVVASLDNELPLDPTDLQSRLHRAAALIAKGSLDQALAEYDVAVRLDERSILALHGRGMLRWRLGDGDAALIDLDHAIRLSFSNPQIYVDRGTIWYEKGRPDRAMADFDHALKLEPGLATAHFYRGLALEAKGEKREAEASLAEAARLNPALARAPRPQPLPAAALPHLP